MPDDLALLRRAIALSAEARAAGQHPFGAVLADAAGRVLMEATNGFHPHGDGTAHAERLLATRACVELPPESRAAATLLSSSRSLSSLASTSASASPSSAPSAASLSSSPSIGSRVSSSPVRGAVVLAPLPVFPRAPTFAALAFFGRPAPAADVFGNRGTRADLPRFLARVSAPPIGLSWTAAFMIGAPSFVVIGRETPSRPSRWP